MPREKRASVASGSPARAAMSASSRITSESRETAGRQLALDRHRPRPDPGEVDRAAAGTGPRPVLAVPAVMADRSCAPWSVSDTSQRGQPTELVAHERQCSAEADRPAVLQQDGPAAVILDLCQRVDQRASERIAAVASQIDGHHPRQAGTADARRQRHPPRYSQPRFGTRGRTAEDRNRTLQAGAFDGDPPSVVARIGLVLVGARRAPRRRRSPRVPEPRRRPPTALRPPHEPPPRRSGGARRPVVRA